MSSTKPPTRTTLLTRDPLSERTRRCSPQAAAASTTGSRKAGQPNRKYNTSAVRAPTTPMRLCTTVDGPLRV